VWRRCEGGGMQRSRRALLKRKAAAAAKEEEEEAGVGVATAAAAGRRRRRRLYGFSVSLVVACWVVLLLLNPLVGHGNGQRGTISFWPSRNQFLIDRAWWVVAWWCERWLGKMVVR
jgi:hypothetical protein